MRLQYLLRQLTFGVRDYVEGTADVPDRTRFVYYTIDRAPFQKWVVFVASIGFLTDAYDIFALNVVLPMLGYVYYEDGKLPDSLHTALLCASLAGTLLGQIIFGILGDVYGRRKTYGFQLLALTASTLGVVMSSNGEKNSMSVMTWLLFWRVVMGIFIGGDYPLSAVITSEFAPRKHRARMLAIVFWMQPLGQLLATLVSLVVVKSSQNNLPSNFSTCTIQDNQSKSDECIRSLDSAWRWVIGVGALPALIAITFRLSIPESPRYLMDVVGAHARAARDTALYFQTDENVGSALSGSQVEEGEAMVSLQGETANETRVSAIRPGHLLGHEAITLPAMTPLESPLPRNSENRSELAGSNRSSLEHSSRPVSQFETEKTSRNAYNEAYQFFIQEGNWRSLVGTTLSWALLDIPFYGLGLSYSLTVRGIWYPKDEHMPISVYPVLKDSLEHELVLVSLGAILGGAIMIKMINYQSPRTIQFWGFLILALLLVATGAAFKQLIGPGLVVMYVLFQMFFNLGPNTTTFMIPAELFPTRFRCTCHGVSAACGKLGSIIAQLILASLYNDNEITSGKVPTSLGRVLLVFCGFMFAGAFVTWYLVPETRDRKGQPRSLEDLALGRRRLEELSREEADSD